MDFRSKSLHHINLRFARDFSISACDAHPILCVPAGNIHNRTRRMQRLHDIGRRFLIGHQFTESAKTTDLHQPTTAEFRRVCNGGLTCTARQYRAGKFRLLQIVVGNAAESHRSPQRK